MLGGSVERRLAAKAHTLRRRLRGSAYLPVLFGVTFPKGGTHLLQQILLGFANIAPFARGVSGYFPPHPFYLDYERAAGRKRTPEEALDWLDSLRPGDVASTHLFARPEGVQRVSTPRFAPYFVYRDPRDIAVSHVFYVTDMEPENLSHDYYTSLPDFDTRLAVTIAGAPDWEIQFPNIAERFEPYLGWLDAQQVLSVRFEDLIEDRTAALNRIIDHLLVRTDLRAPREVVLEAIQNSINPKTSRTFRSGNTGDWRKYFTEQHKMMFKDVAGDLLIQLGYEQDWNW
jgi:hypothetical protein